MAASDARWPPLKNTAWRVTFPLLDADGDPVANGAGDTPDCERSIDAGAFADCSNEMVEIEADSGLYYLDLNASEMNGDCIAIICKTATAGTKTTPIVVYPVSAGFDELSTDHDKTQSDILLLSAKADSDQLLNLADHDKTQSDILLIDGAIDSDHTITTTAITAIGTKIDSDVVVLDAKLDSDVKITSDAILAVSTKIDSDAVLADADHDKTQSDIVLLSDKADSDQVLNLADHDKTQSDILLVDGAIDSDHTITMSDVAALATKADSDQVIALSDIAALSTKADSDTLLADADHDKTQSDILLLSGKADSDQVISLSDIAALATKADSDQVLNLADHDKTQSDILLIDGAIDSDHLIIVSDIAALATKADSDQVISLSDLAVVYSDTTVMEGTAGVMLGTGQTATWASGLEASASTIKEGVAKAGTLSTTQMSTTLTEANNVFNGGILIFKRDTDTAALRLQKTDITNFVNVNGVLTFTAVTTPPAATDTFVIL